MNPTLSHSIVPALSLFLASTASAHSGSPSALVEETPSSPWYTQVSREIRSAEYAYQPLAEEPRVWSAPNRSQELRSRASASGLEVFPRSTGAEGLRAPWKLELRTKSFGRLGHLCELAPASLCIQERRVELEHGLLREWFENREEGLEHGWTIDARPSGDEPLWIDLEIGGDLSMSVDETGLSGALVDASGEVRLHYRDLLAFDASGRVLSAQLESSACGVGIQVDDTEALYPITVDPVLEGPDWTAESNQNNAHFGLSLASAGDVNGDGFDDVIVAAPYYDSGQTNEGRVWLYLGSSAGLGSSAWSADCDQVNALYGESLSTAGDVNGDGYDDVIIGAPYYDNPEMDEGRVWLYFGSAGGLAGSAWTADSDQVDALYGRSVAAAGDVDGDGYDDVIVGAPFYDNPETDEGRVWLYLGSPSGLTGSAWTADSDQTGAGYGSSVAAAGDVDGDGYGDVLVAAPEYDNGQTNEGRVWLYLGSAGGLAGSAWNADSDQASAYFGLSLGAAGDVDHDGFDDVIIAAPYYDNPETNEGRVWLYLGSAGGLAGSTWTADSDQVSSFYGYSVAGAGDVNSDGFDDVIVGAPYFDNPEVDEGRAWVYLGSFGGLGTGAAWRADIDMVSASFGFAVATAGDVNGDGASDVIIGAPSYGVGQTNEGAAFVYLGIGSPGTKYCTATTNSTGAPADISSSGSASAAAGNLSLEAAPVPDQPGIFFHGTNTSQLAFGNGYLCANGNIVRGAVIVASGNVATYAYDNSGSKHSLGAYVWTTRNFQYWFRDPMGGGAFFNTSNAISIAIFP